MPLQLLQNKTALAPGNVASFLGVGGTAPYAYAVLPGGQGGSVDPATGAYSALSFTNYNPDQSVATDTVQVTDSSSPTPQTATATILVGPAVILFIDIINKVMGLPPNRCFLYNGKGFQPTDAGLYIAVEIGNVKVYANTSRFNPVTQETENTVNCGCTLNVHVISVDNSAVFQKEVVLTSLMSSYSIQQQEANSFSIGRIPPAAQFSDVSEIDGPAIPYHYSISINILYAVPVNFNTDIFTSFPGVTEVINA
jgi:hypothetical protein